QIGNVELGVLRTSPPSAARRRSATRTRPRAARARERAVLAQHVVFLALVVVAQDVVGLVDLLEALRRLRVVWFAVRVILLGELAEGLFDLIGCRVFSDAKDPIVVALLGHSWSGVGGGSGRAITGPTLPREHHDPRRTDQRVAELVTRLQDG